MSHGEENKKEAQERAEAARVADQELAAKLDRFIAENASLLESYRAMDKAELIRQLMLAEMKMEHVSTQANRMAAIADFVKENPEIVAKVEERVKQTAADQRERVFLAAAKLKLQQGQGIRASRGITP